MTKQLKPIVHAIATLGLVSASLLTQAASIQNKDESLSLMQSATTGAVSDTLTLGTAYHSEKDGFYALQSVLGRVDETYGNTEMDFVVGVDMNYNQISNMLGGNLGAQLDLPVIKVSAGASYAKEYAADEYTGTYTLYLAMKPKKKLLLPVSDDDGLDVSQVALEIVRANPGDKFDQVGDEFVSAIEYGSQVMVNLKFQYKNKKDKVEWGGQLNVDWAGKVSVGGKLQKVDSDTKRDIKVTVSATQLGGDPNRLLQVIPNQLINCTMENPTPCFDIFQSTIDYIKTDYVNQFESLDQYNVTKVYTDRYKESGPSLYELVPEGDYPTRTILTKLAVKNMSESWVGSLMDNRRADNLLNYYSSDFSVEQRQALEDIRDNSLFNSFVLSDSVSYCNRNPIGDYCRQRELETQGRLFEYNRQWLEL